MDAKYHLWENINFLLTENEQKKRQQKKQTLQWKNWKQKSVFYTNWLA